MKRHETTVILVTLGLSLLVFILILFRTTKPDVQGYTDTVDYQVQEGDTLWNIVSNECFATSDVAQRYDIREVIELVVSLNNINRVIRPGQWITLPYYTK